MENLDARAKHEREGEDNMEEEKPEEVPQKAPPPAEIQTQAVPSAVFGNLGAKA